MQHPLDHNPFSRTPSTWIAPKLKNNVEIDAFDTTRSALIAFSGRGPSQNATEEAAHVSVWIWVATGVAQQGEFFYTDLSFRTVRRTTLGIEHIKQYAFIRLLTEAEAGAVQVTVNKTGIYRIWEVDHECARTARTYALLKSQKYNENDAAGGTGAKREYSKYLSNTYTRTWNCASYAEKVVRAGGVNVSAGLCVTSPLEMTTGNSRRMRDSNVEKSGREWYASPRPPQPGAAVEQQPAALHGAAG